MTGISTQVEATKGVMESAVVLINGFKAKLDAAIQEAIATNDAADLTALTDLSASLAAETDALAAAVASNP
jgi:hypothetical protein